MSSNFTNHVVFSVFVFGIDEVHVYLHQKGIFLSTRYDEVSLVVLKEMFVDVKQGNDVNCQVI